MVRGNLALAMAGRCVGHVQRRRRQRKTLAQSWSTLPKALVNREPPTLPLSPLRVLDIQFPDSHPFYPPGLLPKVAGGICTDVSIPFDFDCWTNWQIRDARSNRVAGMVEVMATMALRRRSALRARMLNARRWCALADPPRPELTTTTMGAALPCLAGSV